MARNTKAKLAKPKATSSSPLLKLFSPETMNPLGNTRSLRHVRDKIYSYVWSRDRRDDQKLDWVVTQWGFNRNVPERYIADTPYGTTAFQRLHELPCNLHLVNKQISKDFTRFIYDLNQLEIDVDLKAVQSEQGEAGLQKIVTLLQNPNFQKYTRTARVRIHFPDKYPAGNLPMFNQRALEDIAWSLNDFQKLSHLAVRVVPAQGALLDYELRVAAFPFYPMRMTHWSIRTLDTTTFPYKWDLLDGQQTRLLDKAWRAYQDVGSLTAPAYPVVDEPQPVRAEVGPRNMASMASDGAFSENQPAKKNGSQKKKYRKKKMVSAALVESQSISASNLTAASPPGPSRPGTALVPQQLPVKVTVAKPNLFESAQCATAISTATRLEIVGTETLNAEESHSASARPPSPPPSPTQPETSEEVTACRRPCSKMADSIVLTPTNSGSLIDGDDEVKAAEHEGVNSPQISRPPSPAPSSATLGTGSEVRVTFDGAQGQNGFAGQLADDSQQQRQRKRKNGKKKPKKAKTVRNSEAQADGDMIVVAGPRDEVHGQIEDQVELKFIASELVEKTPSQPLEVANKSPKLNLSGPNSEFAPLNASMTLFTDHDTGRVALVRRDPRVNRFIRQQERRHTDQAKRQAEQKEARDKRQSRRAKQLLLRRDNITANSLLSRAMTRRPKDHEDGKKKGADNDGRGSQTETRTDKDIFVINEKFMVAELAVRRLGSLQSELQHHCNFQGDDFAGPNDIDSIAQGFVEDIPESHSLEDDDNSEQHFSLQDEKKTYLHSAEDFIGPARVSLANDGEPSSEPEDENHIGQPQNDFSYPSRTLTDDELHDGQDPHLSDSVRNEMDRVHNDKRDLYGRASTQNEDWTAHRKFDDSPGLPIIAATDHGSNHPAGGTPRPFPAQLPPGSAECQQEGSSTREARRADNPAFRHGCRSRHGIGSQCAHAQDAKRGYEELHTEDPSPPAQDSRIESRKKWAAAVQASDEAVRIENRQRRAELEQEMKATGTDYTDYVGPMNDNWIGTDEDGKCDKVKIEQVVLANQSPASVPSAGPTSVDGRMDQNPATKITNCLHFSESELRQDEEALRAE